MGIFCVHQASVLTLGHIYSNYKVSVNIHQLLHIPYKRAKYQLLYFTLQRINYTMKTTALEFYNYLTTVHWLSTTIWSWYFMLIGLYIAIPLHNVYVGTYTKTTYLNDTHKYPLFLTIIKTKKYMQKYMHTQFTYNQ